ncbi:MAG: nucleoid-associated protein EbfC [Thermosediminibacterales bacterium]|nr:nucleoid-associated protein EbfC [Thermosediminibacterales bacterium]MDK2836051.1 nucleoid-associated protein EbfC [Thermosediminibacterales bacterium]
MRGMGNFGNMGKMMKQVKKMQQEMQKLQSELEQQTVEAASGGGAVKAVANGKKELVELIISPEAVDPDDVEMLQDMVLAAVNEALRKAEEMVAQEMSKITGGLNIPGIF